MLTFLSSSIILSVHASVPKKGLHTRTIFENLFHAPRMYNLYFVNSISRLYMFNVLPLLDVIPRNTSSQRKDTVKLDFESMRIQKSYHRADIRRLSTESYVKVQDSCLATQWLWYRKEDNGDWVKYGKEVHWDF